MPADRPNLVLITTDQHRFDAMGCAGNPVLKTPNIDRLAQAGVRFERAYVSSPICQPTRSSILTGRYPHEHGVVTNLIDLPADELTLPQILDANGYQTAAVGHVQPFQTDQPFGFRYVDPVYQKIGAVDNYRQYLRKKGLIHLDSQAKGEKLPFELYTSAMPAEEYVDSYIGRKTVQFIDRAAREPFFLWAGFCGPHLPFDPPEPYDRMYPLDQIPMPPRGAGDLEGKPAFHDWHRTMGFDKLTDELIRKIRAHYYGNITLIDEWIGQIVQALERKGLMQRTIIIFTADHGELLGDHGLLWKCEHSMFEPSVRVPFVFSAPGRVAPGQVRRNLVESVDIAPTFLQCAEIPIPSQVQGRSLLDLFDSGQSNWRDAAFAEGRAIQTRTGLDYNSPDLSVVMIRTERWKFVFHRDDEELCQLYHLENDPNELVNLYGRQEFAGVVSELRERILLWRFDSQRPLHGKICASFDVQMKRPLKSAKGDPSIIWAEP